MKHSHGKMRFLAVKLSALQSELKVSREILQSAGREVDDMFRKKYFPEIPQENSKDTTSDIVKDSEDIQDNQNEEQPPHTEHSKEAKPDSKDNIPTEIKQNNIDPEVKKLFRRISFLIHPDKLEAISSEFEKQTKERLYYKAIKARDDNDLIILADIASELDLDLPDINEAKLKQAENKIIAIKKELSNIESTVVWQWFFCTDPKKKEIILKKIFEFMYAHSPRS